MVNAQSVSCPRCGVNFRERRNKRILLCVAAIGVGGFVLHERAPRFLPLHGNVASQQ
jgi:hypothetical protein